ncbi:MAG: radical SAM protein, partial [Armatimonadota bacterium]
MASAPAASRIDSIADKVYGGQRITLEDARALFDHPSLVELAALADYRKNWSLDQAGLGDRKKTVSYVVGRILNYTNVCWVRCKFCAFYRVPGHDEGYTHSEESILEKVRDTVEQGGTEILFQGGLNPKLKIDWYENIFAKIMAAYP